MLNKLERSKYRFPRITKQYCCVEREVRKIFLKMCLEHNYKESKGGVMTRVNVVKVREDKR